VTTPFYVLLGTLLTVSWGGYLYFANGKDIARKRYLFPYYIHGTMLLFLLLPISLGGPWWVVLVLILPVALIDRAWISQSRFCSACAAYIPARGVFAPAVTCPKCGAVLPQDGG
jgi:hypothetical protein